MDRLPHPSDTPWLRRFDHCPTPEGQVVLFPHAGGSAQFYRSLSSVLSTRLDTLVVQYPHRLERGHEPPSSSIHDMAEQVAGSLSRPDQPLIMLGHSMGALVAYETALLEPAPPDQTLLAVSASRPPHRAGGPRTASSDTELVAELRALGGTDARLWDEPGLIELVLPTVRADYAALAAYGRRTPQPLSCPILTLTGTGDPYVGAEDSEQWTDYTTAEIQHVRLDGDHFYLTAAPEKVLPVLMEALPRPDLG